MASSRDNRWEAAAFSITSCPESTCTNHGEPLGYSTWGDALAITSESLNSNPKFSLICKSGGRPNYRTGSKFSTVMLSHMQANALLITVWIVSRYSTKMSSRMRHTLFCQYNKKTMGGYARSKHFWNQTDGQLEWFLIHALFLESIILIYNTIV